MSKSLNWTRQAQWKRRAREITSSSSRSRLLRFAPLALQLGPELELEERSTLLLDPASRSRGRTIWRNAGIA